MRTTSSRDNWERLVAAVIKRDQIRQLCHQDSITTINSSDTSQQILSYSSNSLIPSPQLPPTNTSYIQVRKNASGPVTRKLFSALLGRRKPKDDELDEDFVDIPGRPETKPPLDWATRRRIAVGAAKGLAYLHHECQRPIIHCDVKAANILLDEKFEAVVADFNLAEFFLDSYDGDARTGIRGTLGHIAPEYFSGGKCSTKADVFSYGVFLLELITAQKSYDLARASYDEEVMLVAGVKASYQMGQWKMMVDIELQNNFVDEEVENLLQIALNCTQIDPIGRPTMLEVVRMLESGDGFAPLLTEYYFINDFGNEYLSMVHHQNTEWIIKDSTSNIVEDELSGPR